MARKLGQIIARGQSTWLVRIYQGRDPQTGTRKYLNQTIHGPFRDTRTRYRPSPGIAGMSPPCSAVHSKTHEHHSPGHKLVRMRHRIPRGSSRRTGGI
jgi:hypothetical protein